MNRPITKNRRRGGIPITTKNRAPPSATAKSGRTIRIIFTDADATDSSSSDEDHHPIPRRPAKRLIHEIPLVTSTSPRRNPHHPLTPPPPPPAAQNKKFRGVRQRPWGRFSAEIRNPVQGKRLWLGTFDTAEEAAAVYDLAALQLKGEKAVTNFPVGKIKYESEASETPLRASPPLPSPTSVLQFDENELPFGEWIGYGDVDAFGFSVVETPLCLSESFIQKPPAIWEEIEFEELDDLSLLEAAGMPSLG